LALPRADAVHRERRFRDRHIQFFRGGHAAFLEDGARFAKALRAFAERCVRA
jgi:hypothetical protein